MPTAELAAGIFSGGPSGNWFSKFANAEALQRQKTTFASQLYTCSSLPLAALSSIAICYPHMMKTRPQVQKNADTRIFSPPNVAKEKNLCLLRVKPSGYQIPAIRHFSALLAPLF